MVIDLTNGIFTFSVVSLIYSVEPSWWSALNLILTICFAFGPDGDFLIFALLRKRLKLASHHIIHFPLILIPFSFALGYCWAGFYGAILFSVPCLGHFVHDSFITGWEKTGIKWLWPFSGNLYFVETLFPIRIGVINAREWQEYLKGKVKGVEKRSWLDEVKSRMEPMGPITRKYLAFSLFILFMFFVQGR